MPPKSVILGHIDQLSPILGRNADVILAVQHGLIGTWGGGYYTDHFGDQGSVNAQQQQDRQGVYDALVEGCLLYTSPSPRDATLSRMPSSA